MRTLDNTVSLWAILPILIVMITGMFVLLADACIPFWRRYKTLSASASLVGIVVAAICSARLMQENAALAFQGSIIVDAFGQACGLILLITAGLAVLLAMTYLENQQLHLGEYYALVLLSTSGAMLMAVSNDLITLFVSVETLSVALYVLAGFARTEERSEEAALKYFLLGAFAAGFLLYGTALIYGGSEGAGIPGGGGTTNLAVLGAALAKSANPNIMLLFGIVLLLVGLSFKASLIPFHMWTPDVYEGAPTSVTAYMAAGAKIAIFAAILRIFNALIPIHAYWLQAIQVLAIITMFGGNLFAISQTNIKRMLAYSSIAHAGYLMVGISAITKVAGHQEAISAITFYLLSYAIVTMGSFGVLVWLSKRGHDVQNIDDLKGLVKIDPPVAYVMLIFMLSLGGIPPTVGFLGKYFIFVAALKSGQSWLAITLAAASVLSIFYYLKVVYMMCFEEPTNQTVKERASASGGVVVSIALTAAASLLLGIVPGLVQGILTAATSVVHP